MERAVEPHVHEAHTLPPTKSARRAPFVGSLAIWRRWNASSPKSASRQTPGTTVVVKLRPCLNLCLERAPNGYFTHDLIVFNHLRRGGYVSKGFIFESPDLTNSSGRRLERLSGSALSPARVSSTKTNGCKCNTSAIPTTRGSCCAISRRRSASRTSGPNARATNASLATGQAMSERKLRRQRVIFYISRASGECADGDSRPPTARRDYYSVAARSAPDRVRASCIGCCIEIFAFGRRTRALPMTDARPLSATTNGSLNPSLNDRFDYDPADGFCSRAVHPGELLAQRGQRPG